MKTKNTLFCVSKYLLIKLFTRSFSLHFINWFLHYRRYLFVPSMLPFLDPSSGVLSSARPLDLYQVHSAHTLTKVQLGRQGLRFFPVLFTGSSLLQGIVRRSLDVTASVMPSTPPHDLSSETWFTYTHLQLHLPLF